MRTWGKNGVMYGWPTIRPELKVRPSSTLNERIGLLTVN